MGAHPKAPSTVRVGGRSIPLGELIRRDPEGILGPAAAGRFGGELPFLFKIIAPAAPLSIQAHPDARQAREGFERENQAGIPLDAPERNYRDSHHKPELLYPLGPFWAMGGFRSVPEMLALLQAAGLGSTAGLADLIAGLGADPSPGGLRRFFGALMSLEPERAERIVARAAAWASGTGAEGGAARTAARRWVLKLHEHYPGDIGVLAPLLLDLVRLEAGQAVFLGPGIPHAYLEGLGVELMANSDNVLRGGLTPKHVDVPELLRILRFDGPGVELLHPETAPGGETLFRTPAREFLLSEIRLEDREPYRAAPRRNVEILLCVAGEARLAGGPPPLRLGRGRSILVPAAAPAYRLTGRARLFKATVP